MHPMHSMHILYAKQQEGTANQSTSWQNKKRLAALVTGELVTEELENRMAISLARLGLAHGTRRLILGV